jgi:DNA-binding response OmpR family regulator
MRELSARLRALARRLDTKVTSRLKAGDLELDFNSHKVYHKGAEVHLTPKEFDLLELLMRHPGEIFTTEAILMRVWSVETEVNANVVRSSVRKLRAKLDGGADEEDSIIENHRKVGYRLRVYQ